ncbi:MAG: VCBS repeat-containing protein, partial [Oleiphilaceae bacterium]
QGSTATADVSVTVNAINDGPVAQNDTVTIDEDNSITLDVLANDTDSDGDSLTVTSASAANGSVIINIDGTVTYIPNVDYNGEDTISYAISDGQGGTASASVVVTINPVSDNTAPVAVDDAAIVDAGSNVAIASLVYLPTYNNSQLLSNDFDVDGDALTIIDIDGQSLNGNAIIVPGSNGGFFTVYPNGNAEFDARTGFENIQPGNDETSTITYTISDGQGGTASATVTVTVQGLNDAPVAVADSASVNEAETVVIDVLANDSDLNGHALTVVSANAQNGVVVINVDSSLSYTPNQGFSGPDSLIYTISDGFDESSSTVSITVLADNAAPVANADTASVNENASITIDVLANDSDIDGDSLTVSSVSATNGSVDINSDGTLTYTPNTDFSGEDIISYAISDGQGGTASASVVVTINPVSDNTAPVAVDDAAIVDAGSNVAIASLVYLPTYNNSQLLSNDFDVDGDALTIIDIDGQSLNGNAITVPGSNGGFFTVYSNGNAAFDARTGFENIQPGIDETSSITYTISDGQGGTASATVTVTVQGLNDAPVGVADSASVNEAETVVIDVLANDSDPNGHVLTVVSANAQNGTVVINVDGSLSYTPNQGFSGPDSLIYTISDGFDESSATVSITVESEFNPPVANDDVASVNENASVIIDVLANDSDIDGDSLTVTAASAANGSVTINTDGTLLYTPNVDYSGSDTISYEISDGQGGTATAGVAVTVNAVSNNTAPVAGDDEATIEAGINGVIANLLYFPIYNNSRLLSNDFDDDGDALTIIEIDGQTLNGNVITVPGSNGGLFTVYSNGNAQFDATTGFENVADGDTTTSSIIYTISDGKGGTDTATVTVTINGVNDNPSAVDDAVSIDEFSSVVIDVLANDTDVDSDTLSISNVNTSNLSGQLVDNGDGTFTYDANQQFDYLNDGQTATDVFEYTIDDGLGGLDTAQVLVTIQGSTVNVDSSESAETSTIVDAPVDDGSNDFMV